MIGNLLIGLREGLEAALVVTILLAYLKKTDRMHLAPRIWAGVGFAVAVSLGFGALLSFGPKGLSFKAQEAIGGTLSILAVALVTWMVFWMAKAARTLSGELKSALDGAAQGHWWQLALVAALAVGREGLETALFLWAATRTAAAEGGSTTAPLVGALIGLAIAVLIGYLLYRGAVKINLGKFFQITGYFLVLVAAGVLAYGLHDLQEAAILPGLHSNPYDLSHVSWLSLSSVPGTLLKGIFNFSVTPTWLEFIAWWLYVIIVGIGFHLRVRGSKPAPAVKPSPTPASASA